MHGPSGQQVPGWAPERAAGFSPELERGVGQFMGKVYGWMTGGLAITAAIAMAVGSSETAMAAIFGSPLKWLAMFGPLAFVWFIGSKIHRMDPSTAAGAFFAFAALMGVSLAPLGLVAKLGTLSDPYAGVKLLGAAFAITAGSFAALAAWGFFTKKDISGWGSFLIMAVWGIILASIIGMIFPSLQLHFAVNVIAVFVFSGLTAYYNQTIKQMYLMHGGQGNLAINGALSLYITFINLFITIFQLLAGGSRD